MNQSQQQNSLKVLSRLIESEHNGMRLDAVASKLFEQHSRNQIQRWIESGNIKLNQQLAKKTTTVYAGMIIDLEEQQEVQTEALPEAIELNIVAEDEQFIVINKPANFVVHPAPGNWSGTLLNALLYHYPELDKVPRAGIVHRLDKDTTGLMVVARTTISQLHLVNQLQRRSVHRHYMALVHGHVQQQKIIDIPIGRHPIHRTKMSIHSPQSTQAKQAITHYQPVEYWGDFTLIKLKLKTGRTHQIRVHLQHEGYPIVGDLAYRAKQSKLTIALKQAIDSFGRQALHAYELGFEHPKTGEPINFEAPLGCVTSTDMNELINLIKNYELTDC